jgi:hypothetical protein
MTHKHAFLRGDGWRKPEFDTHTKPRVGHGAAIEAVPADD